MTTEAREVLGLGTWRSNQISDAATAQVVDRLSVDLTVVAGAAQSASRAVKSATRPKKGRPGYSDADCALAASLSGIWLALTGEKASVYYNEMMSPAIQVSRGARFVSMTFRLVTRKRVPDSMLIDLLRQR